MKWVKRSQEEITETVFYALSQNVNYTSEIILGIPASYLDEKVFSQDKSFLKDAPFLSALVQNPNHIGCHTIGESESFFKGTHEIEREMIAICAEDILQGEKDQFDGYVASGGTEANLQAIWIYRNYFQTEKKAASREIAILCSKDSHYSMDKASNVLGLSIYKVETNDETKELDELPAIIQSLEAEQESLVAQMSDSALYKNEPAKFSAIQEKLAHIEKELTKKFERWEALEAKSLA